MEQNMLFSYLDRTSSNQVVVQAFVCQLRVVSSADTGTVKSQTPGRV
jgi:hypothetical protein